MGDMVPRWQVLEAKVEAYQENTDRRLERIELKVDEMKSFLDNLKGRFFVLAIASPIIVGLILRYF